MRRPVKNPAGAYELEVKGKIYHVDTMKPDFRMDYQENHVSRRNHSFCVLSKEPIPMTPKFKGFGYMCVDINAIRHKDTFPIYLVQRRKVRYDSVDGIPKFKWVYVYTSLDKNEKGKIVKKKDA